MPDVNIDAVMQDTNRSIKDRVKIAILFEDGETDKIPDPSELKDDDNLPGDFDNTSFIDLTGDFNEIIKSKTPPGKPLKVTTVKMYKTVDQCTDAVTKA